MEQYPDGWCKLISPSTKSIHLRNFVNGKNGEITFGEYLAVGWGVEPCVVLSVAEHDALNADRARLVAQVAAAQAELLRVKEMIRHSRFDIDALEELEEMVDADDWDDDEDEEAADNG